MKDYYLCNFYILARCCISVNNSRNIELQKIRKLQTAIKHFIDIVTISVEFDVDVTRIKSIKAKINVANPFSPSKDEKTTKMKEILVFIDI